MTDILTNSASIPYGTWGGGRSLTQSKTISISANNIPYTYSPLVSDIYISTDMTDVAPDTRPVVTNMANYAENNIPRYSRITSIPSGHLPTDINTSLAKDWYSAFDWCGNLTSLPDPFYNTSNAVNMYRLFFYCNSLTTIPNFDTSNVTDTGDMFFECRYITTVPNFNTSKVTNMYRMFSYCTSLTTVPNFNTSKVTSMSVMFEHCVNLTTVPNFNTSSVTNMGNMFIDCYNLTTVPNFDTSNVTDMRWMFAYCYNLTTIPNFDTSNVTDMIGMFGYCNNLTTIPNFDTSNVTSMSGMFNGSTNFYIPIFNLSSVTNISNMFDNEIELKGSLYIESNNVINAYRVIHCFSPGLNIYTKNIYCHANTITYNTIYNALGNNTYNSGEKIHLYTMEDNYATIGWNGNGIYRFPTNKVSLYADSSTRNNIISVTPYIDYNLVETVNASGHPMIGRNDNGNIIPWYTLERSSGGTSWTFQFFKDIPNMTANVVDLL